LPFDNLGNVTIHEFNDKGHEREEQSRSRSFRPAKSDQRDGQQCGRTDGRRVDGRSEEINRLGSTEGRITRSTVPANTTAQSGVDFMNILQADFFAQKCFA
jgi:hypothetical protein